MTKVAALSGSVEEWKGDALLVLMSEEDCGKETGKKLAEPYDSYIGALVERGDFDGKKGTVTKVPLFEGRVKNLYLAGLGKSSKPKDFSGTGTDDSASLRETLTSALRRIGRERNESALVSFEGTGVNGGKDIVLGEAAELCGYVFDKYKKKEGKDKGEKEKFVLKKVFAPGVDAEKAKKGQIFALAQTRARDWANEPGNIVNPPVLAEIASRFAEERGLTCEVWDEKRLARENMGALLAVGQGSAMPPRLIHLTYVPKGKSAGKKTGKKLVFVGKGITFDSGGLDLKSSEFMKTMKGDKSGACNVLGILDGAAGLGLETEIHGIIAAAENMPSGHALRPDDIIRARNGKTIEIDNTDAEGRLVLADALVVASELKPDVIVDMATLTGACAVALGNWSAGLFTKNDALSEALLASARRRGERLWRLPMDDEKIGESMKSKFADLINSGSRYGGATFGAMFLSEFVDPGIAWAHIDIAGADFIKEEGGLYARGASAFGVRTCLDYAEGL